MFREKGRLEAALWLLALAVLVFFGAWLRMGLQPDAALYAGLSAKVLATGEGWRVSGSDAYFPMFFEHPPYFFQWGARVLALFGMSDGAARAIGGIPGYLGFLALIAWVWFRLKPAVAMWTAFLLATFGHYTKFAATAMLEAPLSLGVALAAIGVYEILRANDSRRLPGSSSLFGALALVAGLMIATAAKGVAGFGAMGGASLSFLLAFFFRRERGRPGFGFVVGWTLLAIVAASLPLLYWAYRMANLESLDWIGRYWVEQVAGSATTTRGDPTHAHGGSPLFYFRMILLNGWPWWWTVPAGAWCMKQRIYENEELQRWTLVAFSFWLAFFLPFSLVSFQLAHYLHPTYLVMAPIGGYFVNFWAARLGRSIGGVKKMSDHSTAVRWILMALATGVVIVMSAQGPSFENRGQEFADLAPQVNALPADCPVVLVSSETAPYRMEAYAMWYWHNHPWKIVWSETSEKPARHALWIPVAAPPRFENHCEAKAP